MKKAPKGTSWLVMLDLDDTLVPNDYLFVEAALQSALIVTRALRPRPPNAKELFAFHYDLNVSMIAEFGYGLTRNVESWRRTYRHFAALVGVRIDTKVDEDIARAVKAIENGPFKPFDGAIEALDALRRDGHELHVVTVGEERLQRLKIDRTGVERHVDSVHVTQMQKRTQMQAIAGTRRTRVMMVGDSLRSDMVPAVELGFAAVHVPGCNWAHSSDVAVPEGSYHRIRSISELPALIRHLESVGAIDGKVPQK